MKAAITCLFLLPTFLIFSQIPYDLAPRELFFKEKDKTQVHLSKEGETIFYKKNEEGTRNSIYYLSAGTPLAERKKEFEGEVLDFWPTYDEGLVALVKQDTNLGVFFTNIHADRVRQLDVFPFSQLRFLQLSARFPNKILVDITAKASAKSGIYLLDLLSGHLKRMARMDDFQQLFFDQNFARVAALEVNDMQGHTILRFQGGTWKPVLEHPFHPDMFIGGLSRVVSVSIDGSTIYATTNIEKDKTSLVAIDVESGDITELASDPDADILPYAASIDAAGKPTSVVALWADSRRHYLDESVQKDFEFLATAINGNISFVEASQDDQAWLLRKMDGGPITYYHFDRTSRKLTELFNDYSFLDNYELATRTAHTITTRDQKKLPVHLYLPPGMSKADRFPKTPLPTVVYLHGGPWAGVTHWNSWFHNRNFQLLANRGYAVINMEFRGTTGLGKELCDAGNLEWGGKMHNDLMDVVDWAIRSAIANPKRVAVWGWSYGGYATNFAMAAAPDLFSCGISMYGISDLYEFIKLPFADNDLWRTRVGDPDTEEGANVLKGHSPRNYVENIKKPLLLTTGSQDERVPQKQVDDFAKALHEAGKKVVYFYYPEEGHDYQSAESWISFWAIAENFLHIHTGGRKQPRGADIESGNFVPVYGTEFIEDIE